MITLKAQSRWRWRIAAYLFLAGLGAGAYAIGVVAGFAGVEWGVVSQMGIALGFPSVAVGCLFLIADLGTPRHFWRAWMKPGTSWIARGTLIISIFMLLGAVSLLWGIWPSQSLQDQPGARNVVYLLGLVFAFGTMIYTGILLGAARPIAFWSTAMLPLLFLVSALSTGAMAIVLLATLTGRAHATGLVELEGIDSLLIIVELFVLLFYLQGTHRVPESRASARLVLAGSVAPLFWLGVVVVGLAIPLALNLAAGAGPPAAVGTLCGLAGGLLLRQTVLSGGILAPLRAERFEFALRVP